MDGPQVPLLTLTNGPSGINESEKDYGPPRLAALTTTTTSAALAQNYFSHNTSEQDSSPATDARFFGAMSKKATKVNTKSSCSDDQAYLMRTAMPL